MSKMPKFQQIHLTEDFSNQHEGGEHVIGNNSGGGVQFEESNALSLIKQKDDKNVNHEARGEAHHSDHKGANFLKKEF